MRSHAMQQVEMKRIRPDLAIPRRSRGIISVWGHIDRHGPPSPEGSDPPGA